MQQHPRFSMGFNRYSKSDRVAGAYHRSASRTGAISSAPEPPYGPATASSTGLNTAQIGFAIGFRSLNWVGF